MGCGGGGVCGGRESERDREGRKTARRVIVPLADISIGMVRRAGNPEDGGQTRGQERRGNVEKTTQVDAVERCGYGGKNEVNVDKGGFN